MNRFPPKLFCFAALVGALFFSCGEDGSPACPPPLLEGEIADPLYGDQWHLKNTGQGGGTATEDVNVEPVWSNSEGATRGQGVLIGLVDDGLEIGHEDLAANVVPGMSHNYLNGSSNPSPSSSEDAHGTSCAGVAAARDENACGGKGVAPRAGLAGFNWLQASSDNRLVDAWTREVDISSNSWGIGGLRGRLSGPRESLLEDALNAGVTTGRGGKGRIYLKAAGNNHCPPGAESCPSLIMDNANYDAENTWKEVLMVGGVGDDGERAFYSEKGANLWVSAPTEGRAEHAITTVDLMGSRGWNPDPEVSGNYEDLSYTNKFNGTSSATPLVAGVVALVLQVNPDLTWRDVKEILAETARKNDPGDLEWVENNAGYHFNPNYGFGVVNAQAAVTAASTWTPVTVPQITFTTGLKSVGVSIPDNNDPGGVSDTISVSGSGITFIEWVEVTFSASDHTYLGDLQVELTSPDGTKSVLAEVHGCFTAGGIISSCGTSYSDWLFASATHLGEGADGDWTLEAIDGALNDTGTFQSWQIKFYGR
ncbi:MAG: S8 family serine peptidase [Bdellovibrionota bacterium]